MTITPRVREQLFQPARAPGADASAQELIRIPLTRQQLLLPLAVEARSPTTSRPRASAFGATWTPVEHERFLEALTVFPNGPWRHIAEYVGTKTARQAMTHAQKYRQKIKRHRRALELQARAAQSVGSTTSQSPFSAVTAPATAASALPSNSGDRQLEPEPEPERMVPARVAALEDWTLESFYSDELSDLGLGGDFNHLLFENLLRDADNLADQQLLNESVVLLGGETTSVPFALQPWGLDEPIALEDSDHGSPVEFKFVWDELTRVSHEDIQIWFGERV